MRLVLESQLEDGSRGGGGSGGGGGGGGIVWEGRLGTELKSDIWTGSVIDWGRRDGRMCPRKARLYNCKRTSAREIP